MRVESMLSQLAKSAAGTAVSVTQADSSEKIYPIHCVRNKPIYCFSKSDPNQVLLETKLAASYYPC